MEREVPGISTKEILAILDEIAMPQETEGDMTVKKAEEYWDVSNSTAERRLNSLVKGGKLTKVWGMLSNRRLGYIYRPISQDK